MLPHPFDIVFEKSFDNHAFEVKQYLFDAVITKQFIQRFIHSIKGSGRFFMKLGIQLANIDQKLLYGDFPMSLPLDEIADDFAVVIEDTDEIGFCI